MSPGICARCAKRDECDFRQPGSWVVECGLFEEAVTITDTTLAPQDLAAAQSSLVQPTPTARERLAETQQTEDTNP